MPQSRQRWPSWDITNLRSRRRRLKEVVVCGGGNPDEEPQPITWPCTSLLGSSGSEPPCLRVGTVVNRLGVKFAWSSEHLTAAELWPRRMIGDVEADTVMETLDPRFSDDILSLLRSEALKGDSHSALICRDFLQTKAAAPDWVEWDRIERGTETFIRYLPAAGASLFYNSLVGGYSAQLITNVLSCTGYLMSPGMSTTYRLLEVGQFLGACLLDGADGMRPGGVGWESCIRVRFLHAKIRSRLMSGSLPGHNKWDTESQGIPINQEDIAVTLLSFSQNVIFGIELALGRPLPLDEQLDYLHLWRLIGFYMGLQDKFNPCSKSPCHSAAALESYVMHLIEPNEMTTKMAIHLLRSPTVLGAQPDFERRVDMARRYLGDELADAMRIPRVGRWAQVRASLEFGWLRFHTNLCSLPVLGAPFLWANRKFIALMQFAMQKRNPYFLPYEARKNSEIVDSDPKRSNSTPW